MNKIYQKTTIKVTDIKYEQSMLAGSEQTKVSEDPATDPSYTKQHWGALWDTED